MKKRHGFTLVELLVVIGIIAVLIGILMPTLSRVRAQGYRVACGAQLRDLGNAFQMYINENKGHIPYDHPQFANSFNIGTVMQVYPLPVLKDGDYASVTLWDAFDKYTGEKGFDKKNPAHLTMNFHKIWRCPADRIQNDTDLSVSWTDPSGTGHTVNSTADTYFDAFGTSYEYDFWMNEMHGGDEFSKVIKDAANPPAGSGRPAVTADKYRIMNDLSTFHGKPGALGNMNFLFADWHVGDLAAATSAKHHDAGGH